MAPAGEELTWGNYALRVAISTASHPFEYAKVLIQFGHEPMAPYPTTSLVGRPVYYLPNVFKYVGFIRSVDGLAGCYRGLGPKLVANVTSALTCQATVKALLPDDRSAPDCMSEEDRNYLFLRKLLADTCGKITSTVVSQPFTVIALRMMGQFVGRETKYETILGTIGEIYNENGILGYFSGLVPRLIGEVLALLIAAGLRHSINRFVLEDSEARVYVDVCTNYLAAALTYPFQVVSNNLAVNDCGLKVGLPPQMPIYTSWIDCWSHLAKNDQLKRGNSLIFRYYASLPRTDASLSDSSFKLL